MKRDIRDVAIFVMILVLAVVMTALVATRDKTPEAGPFDGDEPIIFEGTSNFDDLEAADLTLSDDLIVTDDVAVTDDFTLGGDLSVGGSLTVTASSGALTTDGNITGSYIYGKRVVYSKTADYSIQLAESNAFFTNAGASGAITLTLPAAATGRHYCVYTYAAQTIYIDPATGDQIYHLTNSAGDRISNATVGDHVCLVATGGTYWIAYVEHGTWADAN
jgi:hypothetical protein